MEIELKATEEHKKVYREILSSDWSQETIGDCLVLINDFLNASKYPVGYSEVSRHFKIEQFISQDLLTYLLPLCPLSANILFQSPTKLPKRRSQGKIEKHNLVNEVIYDLAFPLSLILLEGTAVNKVIGDSGFLRDIQSLIFMMITEYLIPQLYRSKMKEERNYIIFVLFIHTLVTWYDNPSHQNYLLSILFNELGNKEYQRNYLYNAFKFTSPDEHDYLTKAQFYWSVLMDEERYEEAEHFVITLMRTANQVHLEEIKEIAELTFRSKKTA